MARWMPEIGSAAALAFAYLASRSRRVGPDHYTGATLHAQRDLDRGCRRPRHQCGGLHDGRASRFGWQPLTKSSEFSAACKQIGGKQEIIKKGRTCLRLTLGSGPGIQLGSVSLYEVETWPDLARLIDVGPILPEMIHTGILAMLAAASSTAIQTTLSCSRQFLPGIGSR